MKVRIIKSNETPARFRVQTWQWSWPIWTTVARIRTHPDLYHSTNHPIEHATAQLAQKWVEEHLGDELRGSKKLKWRVVNPYSIGPLTEKPIVRKERICD